MKFFIAFALIAVAAALPRNKPLTHIEEEFQAILDAIHSPSTDPATAQLLLEQLEALLGVEKPQAIDTSPAIIDEVPEAVVEAAPGPVLLPAPAPVVPPASSSPLVQIVVNVESGPVASPVVVEEPAVAPVERPEPVADGTVPRPEPVVAPTPVEVVEESKPVEPVIVSPILPPPVVVIPDILN